MKRDRLIVLDDISVLADRFNKFGSFLTVGQKFKYNLFYIFHIIHKEKKDLEISSFSN